MVLGSAYGGQVLPGPLSPNSTVGRPAGILLRFRKGDPIGLAALCVRRAVILGVKVDVARLILDYIDSLKWVVLLSLVLAWLLRDYRLEIAKAITQLARRLTKLPTPVGPLEFEPEQQQVEPPPEEPPQAPAVDVETVTQSNAQLTAEIAELRTAYEGLAREYQTTRQVLYYEQVYRLIFGSQIDLLQWLRSAYPNPQPSGTLNVYHQKYVGLARGSNATYVLLFDEYLRFLFTSQLIEPVGLDVKLTENGVGFLDYLTTGNLSLFRPL